MTDDPLLPCPFCGAPAELFHNTSSDCERNQWWSAQCSDRQSCWIEGATAGTPEEATQHWNRRYDYSAECANTTLPVVVPSVAERITALPQPVLASATIQMLSAIEALGTQDEGNEAFAKNMFKHTLDVLMKEYEQRANQ